MPTIYESDLVFLESERLTDTDDGGGLATNRIVEHNQSSQVFPGLSRLDATVGRIWLRKLFAGVQSDNADSAYGMAVFVARKPENAALDVILFESGEFGDTQAEIRSAVAGYLDKGARTSMFLYGNHYENQKTLTVIRNKDEAVPGVGEVYCLVESTKTEFVRIEAVTTSTLTLEDDKGAYTRYQAVLTLTQPLTQGFTGVNTLTRILQGGVTVIYESVVNDAARYYGSALLTADADAGDSQITVDTIYNKIIPASLIDAPIADYQLLAGETVLIPACTNKVEVAKNVSGQKVYCGQALLPGSVEVSGTLSWTDQGDGTLKSGSNTATINYEEGEISFPLSGSWTVQAVIAAPSALIPFTLSIPVTVATQRKVYVENLDPPPLAGSVRASVFVESKWYTLRDTGAGVLVGAANIGSGRINSETGTVTLELGVYPDLLSYVLITWQAATQYTIVTRTKAIMDFSNFDDGENEWLVYEHPQLGVETGDAVARNAQARYPWESSEGIRLVDFELEGAASGVAPLMVQFRNRSYNQNEVTLWQWDFTNNGSWDSTAREPSYTYTVPGTYSVKLKGTYDDDLTDTELKTDVITVSAAAPPPGTIPKPFPLQRPPPDLSLRLCWVLPGNESIGTPTAARITIEKAEDNPLSVPDTTGMLIGIVSLNRAVSTSTSYALASSVTDTIQVPTTVTVAQGSTGAAFPVTVLAPGPVLITGPFDSSLALMVTTQTQLRLQINGSNGDQTVYVNAGSLIGEVSVDSPAATAITITVTSSDDTKVAVVTSPVVIPVGKTSQAFTLEVKAVGAATLTATANGLPERSLDIAVAAIPQAGMTPHALIAVGYRGNALIGDVIGGVQTTGTLVVNDQSDSPSMIVMAQQIQKTTVSGTLTATKVTGQPQYEFTVGADILPLWAHTARLRLNLSVDYPHGVGVRIQSIDILADSSDSWIVSADDANDPKVHGYERTSGAKTIGGSLDRATGAVLLTVKPEWQFDYFVPYQTTETIDGQGNIQRTTTGGYWDSSQWAIPDLPATVEIAYSVEGTA